MEYKKIVVGVSICAVLCACGGNNSVNDNSIETIEADMNTPEADCNLDPKVEMRKRDNLILAKYLKNAGDSILLDISEEDAVKLGVSRESYQAGLEDVIRENANLREAKKNCTQITLPDFQKAAEEYEKAHER